MGFVASVFQPSTLRDRDLLMRQRTQLINAMRSHLAELGVPAPQGREGIKQLLAMIADDEDARLPFRHRLHNNWCDSHMVAIDFGLAVMRPVIAFKEAVRTPPVAAPILSAGEGMRSGRHPAHRHFTIHVGQNEIN
jgi:hypothetical protein